MSDCETPARITLAGGGTLDAATLARAQALAPTLVAADGGADRLAALGACPVRIIGDLDSLQDPEAWRARGVELIGIAEQDSTDFDKCLRTETARLILGIGFTGARLDHTLAVLSSVANAPPGRVILLSEQDLILHCPQNFALDLAADTRLSLFPMAPLRGIASEGLRWPIDGIDFAPMDRIGTSNAALGGRCSVAFDGPGMLLILPCALLEAVITALAR